MTGFWTLFSAIGVSGGFGGFLRGIVTRAEYKLRLPFRPEPIDLGVIGDICIGTGAAFSIFLVLSSLLLDQPALDAKFFIQVFAVGIVAGFSGQSLISVLSERLMGEVRDIKRQVSKLQSRELADEFVSLADEYRLKGAFDYAIAFYDRALEIDPQNVLALINKAVALKRKPEPDLNAALATVNEALTIAPMNERALYNRACYKCLLGSPVDEILVDLKAAFATRKTYRKFATEDPDLERIRDNAEFKTLIGV